jgi:fused signal recognition particle receptor
MAWWQRLKDGLRKTSSNITNALADVVGAGRLLDATTCDVIEETLIMADVGITTAQELVTTLRDQRFHKETTVEQIQQHLATTIAALLTPAAQPLSLEHRPQVILMMGVNGSGKTTTTGKLAHQWQSAGKRVRLVAADTFRAAAVEQLQIWAQRAHVPIAVGAPGADAAGLAYDAYQTALQLQEDALIVDTAGRLHTNQDLMAELAKVARVLGKITPAAPHNRVLVLDAVTGQNALTQMEAYHKQLQVNGLILTKLDGTAKGGILLQLVRKFGIPVHAIGVGEHIDDLQHFDPMAFAQALVGLSE